MHRPKLQRNKPHAIMKRVLVIVVMVALLAGVLTLSVFAQNDYLITDGDSVTMHKSFSNDPDVVLNEAGIELSKEDTYTTTYNDGVNRIDIQRLQMVTVVRRGSESVVGTYGETVAELLKRSGISLDEHDVLSHEHDSQTFDGMTLAVIHRESKPIEYDEVIPFETKYYEDPELAPDEEIVLIEGSNGAIHYRANAVYDDGTEVSREIVEHTVIADPVTRLIVHGINRTIADQPKEPERPAAQAAPTGGSESKPSTPTANDNSIHGSNDSIDGNVITTATGSTYAYSDVLTVTATAYSCEGYTGYTCSGTVARVGAVAVDPNYIPLGTKMYIVSNDGQYVYGYCVAEDTGGLIKGYKIDLYFDTFDECWDFGVRTCTVYILS